MTIELYKVPEGGCVLVLSWEEAVALCAIHGRRTGRDESLAARVSSTIYKILYTNGYQKEKNVDYNHDMFDRCIESVDHFRTK